MTKDGGSSEASAAGALTLALGLQKARSSPRIAALASDGGKSCLFRSIVDVHGQPVAEVAVLHDLDRGRVHDEHALIGKLSREEDVAPIAALFRERAVREFAIAPGLPRDLLLYLPWYCSLAAVDAAGPSIAVLLERAPLKASRIVVELDCPTAIEGVALLAKRASWLQSLGVAISLRVAHLSDVARAAVSALAPQWLHVRCPPRFEHVPPFSAFVEGLGRAVQPAPRCIIGGVDSPEDASLAEGVGADYLCGDSVAEARYLC